MAELVQRHPSIRPSPSISPTPSDRDTYRGAVSFNLNSADLRGAILNNTVLLGADLFDARFSNVVICNTDLSTANHLEQANHVGPSSVGIDTIVRSQGKIPRKFLEGCGVPEEIIDHIPSLIGSMRPIQFYSCFISYNQDDEGFAKRLHGRLKQEGIRTWFAPEDVKIGDRFHDEVDAAIRVMDKLLLVLSESSVRSDWVAREVARALTAEKETGKLKLFPIRVCPEEIIKCWVAPDPDHVDLAKHVRLRHIGRFSNWKDHDSFEKSFKRLMHDLGQETGGGK